MQALHSCLAGQPIIFPTLAFHGNIVKSGKAQNNGLICDARPFMSASGLSTNFKFLRGTVYCHALLCHSASPLSMSLLVSSPCSVSMSSRAVPLSCSSSSSSSSSSSLSTPLPSTTTAHSKDTPSDSTSSSSSSSSLSSSSSSSSLSLSSSSSSSPTPLPSTTTSLNNDALFDSTELPTPVTSEQEDKLLSQKNLPEKSFWKSKAAARILLLLVPVFWGTYGPAVRYVYEQPYPPSPSVLTLARKALSLLFFFCFLPLENSTFLPQESTEELASQGKDSFDMDKGKVCNINQLPGFLTDVLGVEWIAAIELGLWTFLGTACQTDGLENTTATRAGFLLQSITVLVPVLSTFSGVKVKPATWAATILALLGVTSMNLHLQHNASVLISWSTISSSIDISRGDLEILLAAFFYALCTVRLGEYAVRAQAVQLSMNVMVFSTILAASWVLFDHTGALAMDSHLLPSPNTVLAIIFSALVPGTLASLGQTIAQKTISAAEAQVYYSMQPFYSAIFAAVILKEDIDVTTWVAGTVLVVAALIASFDTLSHKKK